MKAMGLTKHAQLFSHTHGERQAWQAPKPPRHLAAGLEEFLDSHAFRFIVLSPRPLLSSSPPLL